MKNKFYFIISLSLATFLTVESAYAAWGRKPRETKKPGETVTQVSRQDTDLKKARDELGKKDWIIYLTALNPQKVKPQPTDVLSFSEGKFVSRNLSSQGYPKCNFTLTLQDDGAVVWEATQANDTVGMAFWRGELKNEVIQGVVSILPQRGEVEDFSFTSAGTR